jgi:hypothetical protein
MQMYGTQLKTTTSYYYLGGQRVAMRTPTDGVQWLHSDHLGSASLATTGSGGQVNNSAQRYKPFGELRVAGSGQPSKYTVTGHYESNLKTCLVIGFCSASKQDLPKIAAVNPRLGATGLVST